MRITSIRPLSPEGRIADLLADTVRRLTEKSIDEAQTKAEALISRLLNCRRLELPIYLDNSLAQEKLNVLEQWVKRLLTDEPLQYILGDVEFFGQVFKTDRRALIPRPETELLVETVLKTKESSRNKKISIVDVGTGSGCIAVSLAIHWPKALIHATDISGEALALARENAERLRVQDRITFILANLLEPFKNESLDIVISNPPYVATAVWQQLPSMIRDFEPRSALDGGPDGLESILRLVNQAIVKLKSNGYLFMEIGEDQGEKVKQLLNDAGFVKIEILKDWSGLDRIAKAEKL